MKNILFIILLLSSLFTSSFSASKISIALGKFANQRIVYEEEEKEEEQTVENSNNARQLIESKNSNDTAVKSNVNANNTVVSESKKENNATTEKIETPTVNVPEHENTPTPSNNTSEQTTQQEKPQKEKSIYDYEFDVDKIKSELIAIGQSMGLTHTYYDDGVLITPENASYSNPITASSSFQGERLEKALKDYVRSMPTLISSYGGTQIKYFTIYVQSNGNGSYTFYFLY